MLFALLVDNDDRFRNATAALLRSAGYEAAGVADGRSAQAVLRLRRPDVLVLDVVLPDLSGLDLLQWARALYEPPIPVVVYSGVIDEAVVAEAGRLGAAGYLVKSRVRFADLRAAIERQFPRAAA